MAGGAPSTHSLARHRSAANDPPILLINHSKNTREHRRGTLNHLVYSGKALTATVATLKREGVDYELRRLPGGGIWQLFFHDPCGAKVEFDFEKTEPAPEGPVAA